MEKILNTQLFGLITILVLLLIFGYYVFEQFILYLYIQEKNLSIHF